MPLGKNGLFMADYVHVGRFSKKAEVYTCCKYSRAYFDISAYTQPIPRQFPVNRTSGLEISLPSYAQAAPYYHELGEGTPSASMRVSSTKQPLYAKASEAW